MKVADGPAVELGNHLPWVYLKYVTGEVSRAWVVCLVLAYGVWVVVDGEVNGLVAAQFRAGACSATTGEQVAVDLAFKAQAVLGFEFADVNDGNLAHCFSPL